MGGLVGVLDKARIHTMIGVSSTTCKDVVRNAVIFNDHESRGVE